MAINVDVKWKNVESIDAFLCSIHKCTVRMQNNEHILCDRYSLLETVYKIVLDPKFGNKVSINTFIDYIPEELEITGDDIKGGFGMAYDPSTKQLYFFDKSHATMTIYDIKTKSYRQIEVTSYHNDAAETTELMFIDGELHAFWGNTHYIWSEKYAEFKSIYQWPQYTFMSNSCFIHVCSKKILLMIGGSGLQIHGFDNSGLGIWICDLCTTKWKQIENKIPGKMVTAVMDHDERYIIMTASDYRCGYGDDDTIWIMLLDDNNLFRLNKSAIRCPKRGIHSQRWFMLSNDKLMDEMLISGWIRNVYGDGKIVPSDVINLIRMHHGGRSILHCFRWNHKKNKNKHYVIDLWHLLKCVE